MHFVQSYGAYSTLSLLPFALIVGVPILRALISMFVIGWCTHCKENKRIPNEATPLIDIDSGTTTASALNPSALNPSVDVDTTTCRDYLLGETSFWSDLEKTVIYRLVKPQLFGIQTDKTSGDNVLYGYKVSTPVMYYFFLFTDGLFFATSGIFWTRFLLRESHRCNLQDEDQDRFFAKNGSLVTNCSVVNGLHIVCYKFVFAFNEAFTSAAGVFAYCISLSTAITYIGLTISGGKKKVANNAVDYFLAISAMISIGILATGVMIVPVIVLWHVGPSL